MTGVKGFIQRFSILGVFLALFLLFAIFVPAFLTGENLFNIIVQSSLLGVVALSLTLVMMAGEIDISFSGSIPLLASSFALMMQRHIPVLVALVIICLTGAVIGLINVQLINRLKLNSFVVTVATMFLLTGVWYAFTGGTTIWTGETFNRNLIYGYLGPLPIIGIILLGLFLILYILSEQTPFAMAMRAVKTDPEACRAAGISVERTKTIAFIISGVIFAFGALLSIARLSGAMATAGTDLMLPTMTIAFVGQSMLGMGRPNMPGVLIGALLLGMVNNAFVLMRLPFWSVPMVYGIILMSSIALANIGQTDIKQVRM